MARILFIAKRSPQQRDLATRPYGRFHYLPATLAGLGHDVRVLLCSHTGREEVRLVRSQVEWSTHDIRLSGPGAWYSTLIQQARDFRPDLVYGLSDAWYGWLAARLARACGVPHAVDAYDDYESYMPWNLPLHAAWRRAIRDACLATAAGPQLASLMDRHRRPGTRPVDTVPMAADPGFTHGARDAARLRLGLPADAPLVSYSGAWAKRRGTDLLAEVFSRVGNSIPGVRFVLTGTPPVEVSRRDDVIAVGYLADAAMPDVLRASNVACVMTADTRFGRSSYPSKLYEAMACGIPVVATRTPPVEWILRHEPRSLAGVGDAPAISHRVVQWLRSPDSSPTYPDRPTWQTSGAVLDALVRDVIGRC